ncbi:MAG: DUF697 domain-containing protein [Pseudomonadota bacterium]|nr:DUF697 domain-containing protein [Pseudomonadota bacterium]
MTTQDALDFPENTLNSPHSQGETDMPDSSAETTQEQHTSGLEQKINERVNRASNAHNTVKSYMIAAMGAGLIPIPLFDLAAISAIQLKMIHSISNHYEVKFSQNIAKSLISSLLGGGMTLTTAAPLASLTKTIPFIGHASGIISVTVIAGALTYAIGKIFIEHFESGGTFLDFDPEAMRAHFQELYEEGKALAAQKAKK